MLLLLAPAALALAIQSEPLAVEERVLLEVPADSAAVRLRASVAAGGVRAACVIEREDGSMILYGADFGKGGAAGASAPHAVIRTPHFSPDGAHVTWAWGDAARDGRENWEIWLDGKLLKRWDWVGAYEFSARGELAYQAAEGIRRDENGLVTGGDHFVLRGKKKSAAYSGFGAEPPRWSADGKRLAHVASTPSGHLVTVDGKEQGKWPWVQGLCWSDDGKQTAWTAVDGEGKSRIVVGKEEFGAEREAVGAPALGGGALAYLYAARDRRGLIFGGEVVPGLYDDLGTPSVSADGKRVAVAAARGRQMQVAGWILIDPAWMDDATSADEAAAAASPDDPSGGALDFLGGALGGNGASAAGTACFLLVDGKRVGGEWQRVARPLFAPDGRRVAVRVRDAEGWHVQLDERATPAYDEVLEPRFAADGALEFGARRGHAILWVRVSPAGS